MLCVPLRPHLSYTKHNGKADGVPCQSSFPRVTGTHNINLLAHNCRMTLYAAGVAPLMGSRGQTRAKAQTKLGWPMDARSLFHILPRGSTLRGA
jgi:hypothetical protein